MMPITNIIHVHVYQKIQMAAIADTINLTPYHDSVKTNFHRNKSCVLI